MESDKLTIDTPEQISIEFPLAGIGSRFMAIAVDVLIESAGYVLLLLLANFLLPDLSKHWPTAWNWAAAVLIFVFFSVYWGYYAVFETLWKGQTPGKRLAGIRVIKDTGRPVTAYEAVARNLLRVVDQLPGMYAVGVITMFLNKKSKRIGDFVAGTVVVHERKQDSGVFFNTSSQPSTALEVSKLSNRELEVIETFLARRLDLSPELRRSTAQRLAQRISEKLGCHMPGHDHEDFLEAVAKELRDTMRYR